MNIKDFIQQRPYLIWSTRDYDALSESAIVEAVLNYGNFKDVQTLISMLGIKKTARIFNAQLKHQRVNYSTKIINYKNNVYDGV